MTRNEKILESMRTYDGPLNKRGLPKLKDLREHVGIDDITNVEKRALWRRRESKTESEPEPQKVKAQEPPEAPEPVKTVFKPTGPETTDMTDYEIFIAAGLYAGRNLAIDFGDRVRVAEYYGYDLSTDQRKIHAFQENAKLYNEYRIVQSRRGVHAVAEVDGGGIRIEGLKENSYNYNIMNTVKKAGKEGKYNDETYYQRKSIINRMRADVKYAWENPDGSNIEAIARKAAFLYYRLWGHRPWNTRETILNKTFKIDKV